MTTQTNQINVTLTLNGKMEMVFWCGSDDPTEKALEECFPGYDAVRAHDMASGNLVAEWYSDTAVEDAVSAALDDVRNELEKVARGLTTWPVASREIEAVMIRFAGRSFERRARKEMIRQLSNG